MPVEISDWNDLDNVRNDLTGDYVLVNDLDSETDGYSGIGDNFDPIGPELFDDNFRGTFDGQENEIRNLIIEIEQEGVGLFTGLGLGGDGTELIENLSVSGSVTNMDTAENTGGLVGEIRNGTIQNCVSHVNVTASDSFVGGLVGDNGDTVTDSYATASVEGDRRVGGLVGDNSGTTTDSYATGSVEGDRDVGGLVGLNTETIKSSYAVGLVTGDSDVGGLVGDDQFGPNDISNSYADSETTDQNVAVGSVSDGDYTNVSTLTTSEMQGEEAETNMEGFDFVDIWSLVVEGENSDGDGYPILRAIDFETQGDEQNLTITGYFQLFDLTVETNPATDISEFSATLNGELVELDAEADDADVFFEFGETVGENQTEIQTLTTLDTFDDAVEITTSGQTIEFRAVAEAEDADNETFRDEGDTLTFTTDTATIEGVINPDDPIEGAVVKAENKSTGESYGRDETDADGQYAFENISGLELGQMLELLVDAKRPDEDENLSTVLAPTVGEPGN